MRIIQKAKVLVNIRRKYVKCMERCHDYLSKGVYRINSSLTVVYNIDVVDKEQDVQNFLFSDSIKRNVLLNYFAKLFTSKIRSNGKKFAGQLVIISTNERDYKVFDYDTSTLITIFDSTSIATEIFLKRKKWAEYFPVINFELVSTGDAIREKILEKRSFDHNDVFKRIIKDYVAYFDMIICERGYINENNLNYIDLFKKDFAMNDLSLDSMLKQYQPKRCFTHGDLWASNIIVTDEAHYYIDFENVDLRVFYFDIFMYMFSEEIIFRNSFLLFCYFHGTFDSEMQSLFEAVGECYCKNNRELYFIYFLLSLYSERWKGTQSNDTTQKVRNILKKYLGG